MIRIIIFLRLIYVIYYVCGTGVLSRLMLHPYFFIHYLFILTFDNFSLPAVVVNGVVVNVVVGWADVVVISAHVVFEA